MYGCMDNQIFFCTLNLIFLCSTIPNFKTGCLHHILRNKEQRSLLNIQHQYAPYYLLSNEVLLRCMGNLIIEKYRIID